MKVELKDIKDGDVFIVKHCGIWDSSFGATAIGDAKFCPNNKMVAVTYSRTSSSVLSNFVATPDYPVELIVPSAKASMTKENESQFHLDKIYFHLHHLSNLQGKRYAVKAVSMLKDELQNSDHLHLGNIGEVTTVVEDNTKPDSRFTKQIKKLIDDYLNSKRPQEVSKEQEEVNQLIKALNKIYDAKGCFILDSRGSMVFATPVYSQTGELPE